MHTVAVVGAGTMGNGIAHVFAQNGYEVHLIDVSKSALERALAIIEKNLMRLLAKQKIDEETKEKTLDHIKTFESLREGLQGVDFVVEAATENPQIKFDLFRNMDEWTDPDVVLATNTSSISITKIASHTSRPGLVIGMHFMNPVPVMKLVEVIRGYSTLDETRDLVFKLSEKLGKVPVEVNDYPGFIANRILMPMINEAIEALQTGVAGVKEIDTVLKLGANHPMGPLELADFIGLDVVLAILNVMYEGFKNPKYAPNPLLVNMVEAGKLGVKSGEGFYDYSEGRKAVKPASRFAK
ncbi:MAG: 3-hydroxybutyryl-CoA dehydrogenase [Chlorobi bacterium]|nr:3-hydroxybutyryl-CoA dehydrogenase [Chlorobiota bacterium]